MKIIRKSSAILFKLQLLKLLNRLLKAVKLLLGIRQPLLISLLNGRRDLLEVSRVGQNLLLLLDVGLGLLELLLSLGDLGIEVDAALDVQEDGGLGGDRVGDATGGSRGVGAQDLDVLDALAAESLDGGDLILDGSQ